MLNSKFNQNSIFSIKHFKKWPFTLPKPKYRTPQKCSFEPKITTINQAKVISLFYILHWPHFTENFYFLSGYPQPTLSLSSHSTLLAWLGPLFHQSLPSLHSFHNATDESYQSMVHVGKMHRDSKLLALFPWYPY